MKPLRKTFGVFFGRYNCQHLKKKREYEKQRANYVLRSLSG